MSHSTSTNYRGRHSQYETATGQNNTATPQEPPFHGDEGEYRDQEYSSDEEDSQEEGDLGRDRETENEVLFNEGAHGFTKSDVNITHIEGDVYADGYTGQTPPQRPKARKNVSYYKDASNFRLKSAKIMYVGGNWVGPVGQSNTPSSSSVPSSTRQSSSSGNDRQRGAQGQTRAPLEREGQEDRRTGPGPARNYTGVFPPGEEPPYPVEQRMRSRPGRQQGQNQERGSHTHSSAPVPAQERVVPQTPYHQSSPARHNEPQPMSEYSDSTSGIADSQVGGFSIGMPTPQTSTGSGLNADPGYPGGFNVVNLNGGSPACYPSPPPTIAAQLSGGDSCNTVPVMNVNAGKIKSKSKRKKILALLGLKKST